jgi:hypothetical protein
MRLIDRRRRVIAARCEAADTTQKPQSPSMSLPLTPRHVWAYQLSSTFDSTRRPASPATSRRAASVQDKRHFQAAVDLSPCCARYCVDAFHGVDLHAAYLRSRVVGRDAADGTYADVVTRMHRAARPSSTRFAVPTPPIAAARSGARPRSATVRRGPPEGSVSSALDATSLVFERAACTSAAADSRRPAASRPASARRPLTASRGEESVATTAFGPGAAASGVLLAPTIGPLPRAASRAECNSPRGSRPPSASRGRTPVHAPLAAGLS